MGIMNLSDSHRDQGCQKTDPTGEIDFSPRNPDEIADPGFPKSTLALSSMHKNEMDCLYLLHTLSCT